MSDSLKKVLLGAVVGALLVGFAWHIHNERAKHAAGGRHGPPRPAAGSGAGDGRGAGTATPGGRQGGAASQRPVGVIVGAGSHRATGRRDRGARHGARERVGGRHGQGVEPRRRGALRRGPARASRRPAGRTRRRAGARGPRHCRGRADTESRSQYKRSRELYTTKALSEAQLDQIEAALKANEARVLVAQAKLGDTMIRAPFAGRVGLRRVSVGSLVNPGTVITTLDDTGTIKLDFTVPETFLSMPSRPDSRSRRAASPIPAGPSTARCRASIRGSTRARAR